MNLKTIHINGEATITFSDETNVTISQEEDFLIGVSKGLSEFLQEMFVQENMSAAEKEHIMSMSVREFCDCCSNIKGTPEQEPKLTRAEFLSNMHKIPCGICHSSNALTLVDGVITCRVCGATLGDIDDHPTF